MALVSEELGDRPWFLGEQYSLVDVTYCTFSRAASDTPASTCPRTWSPGSSASVRGRPTSPQAGCSPAPPDHTAASLAVEDTGSPSGKFA